MGRLDNKVAIITGGASGMGLAAVKRFTEEGAKVVPADISEKALATAFDGIDPDSILPMKLDVSDEESWKQVVDSTIEKFGKIDILCNNAGLHLGPDSGILETSLEDWNRVMAVDVTGAWLGMKAVIPHMQAIGGGSIINTSSVAALVGGLADGGSAAYSAAKGGIRSLSKHASQAFAADSIRVNSVHPGVTMTGGSGGNFSEEETAAWMEILKREVPLPPHYQEAVDQANAYLFLASDEARQITGIELIVDGGWMAH